MSDRKLNQVSQHKHIVIAAIAVSGLMLFAFANMVQQASAQTPPNLPNLQNLFNRVINIPIPCSPYCNIDNEPEDREIATPFGTIRLNFGFISLFRGN